MPQAVERYKKPPALLEKTCFEEDRFMRICEFNPQYSLSFGRGEPSLLGEV
jgi:hypothetical protein